MELTQVRYFLALSRTLNFTRAAEACSVTQPALTRAIQRLEYEMGGPLIRRERNLTHLTELGRTVLPHLDMMLSAADSAISLADARRSQPPMSIKIGLGPGVSVSAIGLALHEVGSMLPNLTIRIKEAGASMLVEGLLADNLDCALIPADHGMPERLNHWTLYEENLAVILPRTHALAAQPSLTMADLAGETILQSDKAGSFAERLTATDCCTFTLRRHDGTIAHLLDLVAVGLGIIILPETVAVPAHLVIRRLIDPVLTRQVALTVVAGRPHGPALAGFVKICRTRRMLRPAPPA